MRNLLIQINAFFKGLILFLRPHILLGFLRHPMQFSANLLSLTKWISQNNRKDILNDFYTIKRIYPRRYNLYNYLLEKENLKDMAIDYLEFGVSGGLSFKWWTDANRNANSRFYGFDTFEGLPEDYGVLFPKGDMSASVMATDDKRVEFVKGLFQDTLLDFLHSHPLGNNRKVIHMDADIFSATLYALSNMAVHLKKNDVILFDEFNVPNHEFRAYKCFIESFYVKMELIGAVNNYLQVAFRVI